ADYSANNGNAVSFSQNSYVLPLWIYNTLNKAMGLNFSSGKVDVVCHSMGGVLTRLYLNGQYYANDIHTITTINTPHSGTQGANILLSTYGLATAGLMQSVAHKCVTCGGVSDLKINS